MKSSLFLIQLISYLSNVLVSTFFNRTNLGSIMKRIIYAAFIPAIISASALATPVNTVSDVSYLMSHSEQSDTFTFARTASSEGKDIFKLNAKEAENGIEYDFVPTKDTNQPGQDNKWSFPASANSEDVAIAICSSLSENDTTWHLVEGAEFSDAANGGDKELINILNDQQEATGSMGNYGWVTGYSNGSFKYIYSDMLDAVVINPYEEKDGNIMVICKAN